MKTPEYRGTRESLESSLDDAKAWFLGIVKKAALALPHMTDEVRDELTQNGFKFTCDIERIGDPIWVHDRMSQEYLYVWRIQEVGSYREYRFVLRKDGTVNMDKASSAAFSLASAAVWKAKKEGVLLSNKSAWSKLHNCRPRDFMDGVGIELSDTHEDQVKVFLREYDWGFSATKTMQIADLPAFISLVEGVKKQLNEFGK